MSDDSKLETALKNLSIQDNQYLKDLKEKTYRQVANSARQARDRPFNYLEYPLLRNRIVRRDEIEHDLMPGMYLNYPDPEGDIRDMASNVMGKKLRNKLTMRKDRLKFATDKLYLAKLINKGIISEDIARKVARSRFNLKGGTNNSELTDEQEIKHEFLSGIKPDPDIAIRRIQSRHRGNLTRKKLSNRRRQMMEPEPEPEPEGEYEIDPVRSDAPEPIKQTAILPLEVQDMIGLLILKKKNESLVSEIDTSGQPPPQYTDVYFADLIIENIPGLKRFMLISFMKMDVYGNAHFIPRGLNKIFGFPMDVANIFISTITANIKADDIDPLYSSTTFSSFLNYLIFDDIENLKEFLENFREKLESNYTPFEIERFITDFLNALKPVKDMKGGTNSSELTDEQEIKDEFLSGIQPAWKSEPIIPRNNYSAFLKHITDLPFDLQDMVGNTRDKLVKEKIEELKDIKRANAYFIKKLTSKYITRLRLFYNLEKNIKKYKKNVNKDLIFKKIRYDTSYISEINELFSFDDYKVSEIFVKILIELSDALLPGENTTLEFLLQYIYDNARIYLLIDIFEKYLTTDDSIDTKIKIEKNLKKILIMLDLQ